LRSFSRLEFHSFDPPMRSIWSPTKWGSFPEFFPGDGQRELGQGQGQTMQSAVNEADGR